MKVQVKLFATLRDNRFSIKQIDLPETATMADLLDHLDIPEDLKCLLLVNGRHVKRDQKLNDKDTTSIFPAIAGG